MAADHPPTPDPRTGASTGTGAPPPSRTSAGRIVAGVVGAVLVLPALAVLGAGTLLLWVDQAERSDDGYLYTASDAFSTPGHALLSERIDLETGADWVGVSAALGTARVEVTGTDAGTDLFVGVAPESDAQAYLGGVERTVVDDLGLDTSASDQVLLSGGAPADRRGSRTSGPRRPAGPEPSS